MTFSITTNDAFQRPLRDLRISVTDRCNFRCPYCMPADLYGESFKFLPRTELLTFEEIERLARLSVGLGVCKIRITGGEPLLRSDVEGLIARLATIDGVEDLALTTNGYLLAEHAAALARAGLGRVTVSLDALDEGTFRRLNGDKYGPEQVLEGIDAADRAGLGPVKINCVVVRGVNEHAIVPLARRFKGSGHVVRFIEYMDVGTLNRWDATDVVTANEIVERVGAELPLEPTEPGYRGEVARRWVYRDGSGEIGVIASVSIPFCGDCTRARLTSEGKLVTCLFATGGTDLKGPLRRGASDAELEAIMRGVWSSRDDRYSELRARLQATRIARMSADAEAAGADKKIEMYRLGG
jgi:cyclic pyranopterin phosphate synthase